MSIEDIKQRALYLRTENRDRDFRSCAKQAVGELLTAEEMCELANMFDITLDDIENSVCEYLKEKIYDWNIY